MISIRYNVLSVLACVSMLAVNAGVVAPVQEQEVFNPEHLTAKEKINAANQSLLTFIVEGGSLTALMTDPGFGAFFIYEFGMQYPVLNKTLPVKNPADFKNMVPLRKQGFFNYVKQVDFKFDGYRKLKAPLCAVVEDAMSTVGLLEPKQYEGTFFKDEYDAGVPMVFNLETIEQLRGLQEYFVAKQIVPRDMKPWLLIHTKKPIAMTQADCAFWGSYFELVKRSDAGMEEMIRGDRDLQRDFAAVGCKGKYICHTIPEVALLKLEGITDDLKTNDLIMMAIGAGSLALGGFLKSKLIDEPYSRVADKEQVKSGLKTAVTVAKCAAVAAAAFALYRIWQNIVDTTATKEELEEIRAQQAAIVSQEEVTDAQQEVIA